MSKIVIRPERSADREAVAAVIVDAFGQPGEAKLVAALRQGNYVVLSLIAEEAGRVVGHILFSRIGVERNAFQRTLKATALAPLSVAPASQRRGIGTALVRDGLLRLAEMTEDLCFVLGEPAYYRRFGFDESLAERFESVYAMPQFMAIELNMGRDEPMSGALVYPEPFAELA